MIILRSNGYGLINQCQMMMHVYMEAFHVFVRFLSLSIYCVRVVFVYDGGGGGSGDASDM